MERTYRISDVVNEQFLRFPVTLLANPKYKAMSLESKFIYSLLLNRLTLSQKNGWINEDNEVYLIYTREEASNMLNISYKKTIAAFKELIVNGLLFQKRQGRGYPNLLFVLKVTLDDKNASDFSESYEDQQPGKSSEVPVDSDSTQTFQKGISRDVDTAHQELSNQHIKNCQTDTSESADITHQELSKLHPNKNDINNTYVIQNDISQSVSPAPVRVHDNGQADKDNDILENIFENCELGIFKTNLQTMFKNVIERLYYSDYLKIGNARLPQMKIRSYLNLLDSEILMAALDSMKQNEQRIKNPTAYLMSTIFNGICEKDSDLILSLPAQYLNENDFYMPPEEFSTN